jgi:hypothetical protein
MTETPKRIRERGVHSVRAKPRRSREGDPERDAGAQRELEELDRAEREQRRRLDEQRKLARRDAEG